MEEVQDVIELFVSCSVDVAKSGNSWERSAYCIVKASDVGIFFFTNEEEKFVVLV